jgi:hypothetical protein
MTQRAQRGGVKVARLFKVIGAKVAMGEHA